jgi:hypothetical protein
VNEGQKEGLRRNLEREMNGLAELGKIHLSFPKIHWKISIGFENNRESLWAEMEIGLSEVRKWKGQVGEIDKRERFEEIQQQQDNVPDRIRERWNLGIWVEVRTTDGRVEKRQTVREVKNQEDEGGERGEKNEVKEKNKPSGPVRIDKADLLAEPIEEKVAETVEPAKEPRELGVSMRTGKAKGK